MIDLIKSGKLYSLLLTLILIYKRTILKFLLNNFYLLILYTLYSGSTTNISGGLEAGLN